MSIGVPWAHCCVSAEGVDVGWEEIEVIPTWVPLPTKNHNLFIWHKTYMRRSDSSVPVEVFTIDTRTNGFPAW